MTIETSLESRSQECQRNNVKEIEEASKGNRHHEKKLQR